MCYWIPIDGLIEGEGYRVSVVKENQSGHIPTGHWPYDGRVGQQMPYFWGKTYDKAIEQCKAANARLGLTTEDVDFIMASSMRLG